MKRVEQKALKALSRYMQLGIAALTLLVISYPILTVLGYDETAHEMISIALPSVVFILGYAMGRYGGPATRILERS